MIEPARIRKWPYKLFDVCCCRMDYRVTPTPGHSSPINVFAVTSMEPMEQAQAATSRVLVLKRLIVEEV